MQAVAIQAGQRSPTKPGAAKKQKETGMKEMKGEFDNKLKKLMSLRFR